MSPAWLHGWPRIGPSVLMGTSFHCIGCGVFRGTGCVAICEDAIYPTIQPEWPFDEASCPVHKNIEEVELKDFDSWPPRVVDLYTRVKVLTQEVETLKRQLREAST